jgi:lysyl-tRNA synthetase class 2
VNTSQESTKSLAIKKRSRALQRARDFFYTQGYFEVDCPLLSPFAALDNHIDLITTSSEPKYFLHSSPEYGMKKLLSLGAPSLFQISHVFRAHETGSKHAQEFMMVEFYKLAIDYQDFISETCRFIELFTGPQEKVFLSYKQAFLKYLGLNPFHDQKAIFELVTDQLSINIDSLTPDDLLTMAMSALIEPLFDPQKLTIITDFPSEQAALAEASFDEEGEAIAKRFEIYHQYLELANGYKELKCSDELQKRFLILNKKRSQQDKDPYPIDVELLQALQTHFPDCCGVACGFDRLMMIEQKSFDIKNVLTLPSV